MSDFNDWKEEQERIHNDYDAENAWYAGAQSRQAEINELQNRIDKALAEVESGICGKYHIEHIIKILKGS